MELKDLLLTPLYLGLFYGLAYAVRNRVANVYTKKYFIPALSLKFFGAISLGLIYQFYYRGGDTLNYFNEAKYIHQAFFDSPAVGLKLLLTGDGKADGSMLPYVANLHWFAAPEEYVIVRLCGFLGLFCGHTYAVIALMFALLSFSGMWALYGTFARLYPHLYKELAIAVFFIPSVFFWGSGISKDAICLGALGWLFYGFYNLMVARRSLLKAALVLLAAGLLIKAIKIYILISFVPPVMLWVSTQYSARIKSKALRVLLLPFMIVIGAAGGLALSQSLAAGNRNYDFTKIEDRAKVASQYHNSISQTEVGKARGDGNSGYSIEDFTGPADIPKIAPKALVIGLFRPFLWEVRNPVMLLSALEVLWITLLTLRIFWRVGVLKTLREIGSTPLVLFGIIFTLIFAIATASTSGNFGNLVRYRVPMWPFYVTALFVLESSTSRLKESKVAKARAGKRRPEYA